MTDGSSLHAAGGRLYEPFLHLLFSAHCHLSGHLTACLSSLDTRFALLCRDAVHIDLLLVES